MATKPRGGGAKATKKRTFLRLPLPAAQAPLDEARPFCPKNLSSENKRFVINFFLGVHNVYSSSLPPLPFLNFVFCDILPFKLDKPPPSQIGGGQQGTLCTPEILTNDFLKCVARQPKNWCHLSPRLKCNPSRVQYIIQK